jgi:integrase
MKFFFPDSQDFVDESFDFATEQRSESRIRQQDDVYPHDVFSPPPYDGLLVSKAIGDDRDAGSGKYTVGQQQRLLRVGDLKAFGKLAGLRLDAITPEVLADFAAYRRADGMQISTINRDLATVRRIFHLAQEWGRVTTILPRVRMLPGERRRERVLTVEEEQKYFQAAVVLGRELEDSYRRALEGIRATTRGEQPKRPDAYLLRDVATVLVDCGLRPEECHRLKWENTRDGAVEIFTGKRKASRRRIPASGRVLSVLDMRRTASISDWVFPADPSSGHIETGTLKKQHDKAVKASKIPALVPYDLSAYLPDPVGEGDGPFHAQETRWPCGPEHHDALCSPQR